MMQGPHEIPSHVKLAQDRSAYMTFLEVQLERVTQACTNALSFQEKVETLQTQVAGQEEKVSNIGRLVKLLQSFSEAQEEDVQGLKIGLKNISLRNEDTATQVHKHGIALHAFQQSSNNDLYEGRSGFGQMDIKHSNSVSPTRSKRSLSKSKSPGATRRQSDHKVPGTIDKRVSKLESAFKSMHDTRDQNNNLINNYQQNSFGTLEPANVAGLNQIKEDLGNFAQEVDKQMREVEARVVNNLSQHFEEQNSHTNSKIDEALMLLDQKVTRVEQMNSASCSRSNVIQSTQIIEDGRINPAKMEAALNDWLSKVEEQVNQIENQVNTRAALIDFKSLERRIMDQHEEREVRFQQLEQYCQRMIEQGNSRYEEVQELSLDWEDRFLNIQRQVEVSLNEQERSINFGQMKGSLLQSGLTSLNDVGGTDLTQLRSLEKKLARRLGDGVERLGSIIKDMAKAQRKLETRTNGLEIRVFGSAKTGDQVKPKKKLVAKGSEGLTQSGRLAAISDRKVAQIAKGNGAKQGSGSIVRKNSNSAKSPAPKQQNLGRRSQKQFSPPVKDASQGADKRSGSIHRRSRSKQSVRVRSNSGVKEIQNERPCSISARNLPKEGFNNFRTSFEQRLIQDESAQDEMSPREILRRARDRSVRELSQSLNESRSRSPHSQRLQSFVELEQASPHQHRLSSSFQKLDQSTLNQNVSILNGPVSGQKNIVAPNFTQPVTNTRAFEMDQFKQRGNSGLNTGRDYMTHPGEDLGTYEANRSKRLDTQPSAQANSTKRRKSSAQRSAKKIRKTSRSASRERSRDHGYTLQELERKEKSLQRKLIARQEESGAKKVTKISNTSRNNARQGGQIVEKGTAKDRSLSSRTFQKMGVIGQNTLLAAQRGSATSMIKDKPHDISYGSQNKSLQYRRPKRVADKGSKERTLSPNKAAGQLKTTKSASVNVTQQDIRKSSAPRRQRSGSVKSGTRVRSRSLNNFTETSEPRSKPQMGTQGASARVNQTAAQEIFHKPFDYHQSSHDQFGSIPIGQQNPGSRRSSNQVATSIDNTLNQQKRMSAKRQRSISIEHSRDQKESTFGRKKGSSSKMATPVSSKKASSKVDTSLGAASKTAKQKLKNLQNKKSNQRLARLEKMYQELTEIEAKTASQI